MQKLLLIGAGGFLGSVLRYAVGGLAHRLAPGTLFPVGTLAVNVLGCLALGFLHGLAGARGVVTPEARLFLMIGLLGGFTTFSTFGLETLALAQEAEGVRAAANVVLNLGAGLAAVWLGHLLGRIGMG
jgi:CrcB protein